MPDSWCRVTTISKVVGVERNEDTIVHGRRGVPGLSCERRISVDQGFEGV